MISGKMTKAINEQINKELYSSYLYLAMSAQAEALGLKGFANWFKVQAAEENEHAMKFFDYLGEQGARVKLAAIDQPPVEFKSPKAMFEETLKHEKTVTASINALADLALAEKDHATGSFLRWFVDEQVEEEANAQEIVDWLKLAGEAGNALLFLDSKLRARKAE
ncbi:MAG TPA: ferritin [Kiritimatiellia bacterium]|nr:ferritin [Kiritimatiellia bacterium]HRZ11128.1 ferritin [Kiritimatiellia bacterium]HSA19500.1 ferritin [Kiritimatiellia bacterium]